MVSCACVYFEHGTAGEPGAVAGVSGCLKVDGGLQGARPSSSWLGVACASGHEGKIGWALSGLHLQNGIE